MGQPETKDAALDYRGKRTQTVTWLQRLLGYCPIGRSWIARFGGRLAAPWPSTAGKVPWLGLQAVCIAIHVAGVKCACGDIKPAFLRGRGDSIDPGSDESASDIR